MGFINIFNRWTNMYLGKRHKYTLIYLYNSYAMSGISNVGELFKFLGNNPLFLEYIKNGYESGKPNTEIIDEALADQELTASFDYTTIPLETVRNKMEIVIGQKRKGLSANKPSESDTNNNITYSVEEDEFAHMKHKPLNRANVVWLWNTCYMERDGTIIRLIHGDWEMFY